MNESAKCEYFGVMNTTNRDDEGCPQCTSCSNKEYFNDLSMGRRVELKIDMRKVKQSTLMQIKALILKDIEEYNSNESQIKTTGGPGCLRILHKRTRQDHLPDDNICRDLERPDKTGLPQYDDVEVGVSFLPGEGGNY